MLEKLSQRQHQIADAARLCHCNATEVDLHPSSDGSAFSEKSSQVRSELQSCIAAVSALITRLGDLSQQRLLVSKIRGDLSAWLECMNNDVGRLMSRPAKLHIAAAELEMRQLEVKAVINVSVSVSITL